MTFTTTIATIRSRIADQDERQRIKDEKKLAKYRAIINERLRSMSTIEEHVFFSGGKAHLLERLADELITDGFDARIHQQYFSYPEGVHLFIRIPLQDICVT